MLFRRRQGCRCVLYAGIVLVLVGLVHDVGYANNYIGAERCKSCHEFAYEMWSKGPHASAHLSLTPEQREDPKCSTCHTMVTQSEGVQTTHDKLLGVQCERCHGPGKYYHPEYVMKDKELSRAVGLIEQTAAHCQQCHTEGTPAVRPFDFARMWSQIDHGESARKARGATHGKANSSAAKNPTK